MPAFYIYIIECKDKKDNITFYTGYTKDLYKRFKQHQDGSGAKYTKGKKLKLVHYETFLSRSEAMRRENEIKKLKLSEKKELVERSKEAKK